MFIPPDAHIMVVDGARMTIFRNAGNTAEPRLEIAEQAHRQAPRTSALGTDRPGRTAQSRQAARSAMDGSDFHAQAEVEFAVAAAARLANLLKREDAPAILVAEPRVLGIVRDHLDPHLRKRLIAEIDKDLAGRSAANLADMLIQYDN